MIEPGTLLQGRYRVVKQIGHGGMGAVYVATDERFHSTVAIKQTFFFEDPVLGKAFEREAHLLNHLRHAALPKVSDHFIEGDGQFLVMEFIEGSDLSQLLQERGGAFPVSDVMRWADEILDALDYLHTHKPPVVHRDIKPQNLKLTTRRQIVLLDFGLAKGATMQAHASVTGSVLGYSPHYAPLEQVQGTGTDARSDLYSLAATLYHLLTGSPPVDALTRASAVINNQPDPLRPAHLVHIQVPEAVSKIVHRAMSQKAALRPASAAEMREALRQVAPAARKSPAALRSASPSNPANPSNPSNPSNDATVVETPGQSPSARAAASNPRPATLRPMPAPLSDETLVESPLNSLTRVSSKTHVAQSSHTSPVEPTQRSWAKLLVVAAVLAICAVAAFTLTSGPGTPKAKPEAQGKNPPVTTEAIDGTGSAQTDTPALQNGTNGRPANASTATQAEQFQTQSPSARSSSDAAAPTLARPATRDAGGNGAVVASDDSNPKPAETGTASPASGITTQSRQGLVIQQPAPSPQPTETRARDDARREREFQPRQDEQPPPPPRDGWPPPPPPPGGGRPFPPPRRPPNFK